MAEPEYSGQNRVVVDWDGTCVPQEWPGRPTEFLPGAVRAMGAILGYGLDVYIWTTRLAPLQADEKGIVSVLEWLDEFNYIRDTLDGAGLRDVRIWTKPWKPGARYYVDDKGVRYTGNWQTVLDVVLGDG